MAVLAGQIRLVATELPGVADSEGLQRIDHHVSLAPSATERSGSHPVSLVRRGDQSEPGAIGRSPTRSGNSSMISRGSEIARGSRGSRGDGSPNVRWSTPRSALRSPPQTRTRLAKWSLIVDQTPDDQAPQVEMALRLAAARAPVEH